MIQKRKKHLIQYIVIVLVTAGVVGILFWNPHHKAQRMSYADFYAAVSAGQVSEAVLTSEGVYYRCESDQTEYVTDNPGNPEFKEYLLLHGVKLSEETSAGDILYAIVDGIVNLIFIGILVAGIVFVYRFYMGQFQVVRHVDCRFSDIAGMEEEKRDFAHLAELMKHPEQFDKRGVRQPNGILLAGPPGNGKTLFARALAGECGMHFIATKATDFQSMYMSIGPAKIKALFRQARKCAPCIVFIDEFDGLGERRNYAGQAIDKENNRIVTALLNELDGFEGHRQGVLVVAATNNLHELDPALIRPGRFDRRYVIKNPDQATREQLIRQYAGAYGVEEAFSIPKLAKTFDGMSCAQIEAIMNEACLAASERMESEQGTAKGHLTPADIEIACKRIRSV